jgi:GTPase SAR1 family protein
LGDSPRAILLRDPERDKATRKRKQKKPGAMSSSLEAKIVVLGSQGVGKTSLVMRYCKGSFNPSQITSTVGASFLTKRVIDTDTDTLVRLQIWDTGNFRLPLSPQFDKMKRESDPPLYLPSPLS